MIDNIIKAATCRVSCGSETGTGHLITACNVLTARHCIIQAIESQSTITLIFSSPEGDLSLSASIVDQSEEIDLCILSVSQPLDRHPIPLTTAVPREGDQWRSFGYPIGKTSIGHRIEGTISHVLDAPKLKMDIDLTVDPSTALADCRGLSGAAVVSDNNNTSIGMIRLKIDGTLGAISFFRTKDFFEANEIPMSPSNGDEVDFVEPCNDLAERNEFQERFEQLVARNRGNYVFLEGAHGIGKTTFCSEFESKDQTLFTLGLYSFTSQGHGPSTTYRAQPGVFFDWLSTTVSSLITGKASRKGEQNYATLIKETSVLLENFSAYCETRDCHGVLFLDGLNEVHTAGSEALAKLIGLLPLSLPQSVTIVLTAPNYPNMVFSLDGRVKSENVISLPPLTEGASQTYCWQELVKDRASPALITRICDKAQGHPLYLRYLIEYVNSSSEEGTLDDFPILIGTIEQYYDSLWPRLLEDDDAINLLAIIARLRWGIERGALLEVLSQAEQAVFISTFSRIRHLLLNPETTTIYHPSFTEYLISKTVDLESTVHKRLAEYCFRKTELDYCAQNIVFHLLRSDEADRLQAIDVCIQSWINTCVELGVEPDTLLSDVEATLSYAVSKGPVVEVLRLLLLSQRVSFRYNTLFAQSARLIAEALISLKRPQEVLKYAIRYNTLIVTPEEALQIALCLIQHQYSDEALKLLRILHQKIIEEHDRIGNLGQIEIKNFVHFCRIHLQTELFIRLAVGGGRMNQIIGVASFIERTLTTVLSDASPEILEDCLIQIKCLPPSYFLCFHDTYADLHRVKEIAPEEELPSDIISSLIWTLFECEDFLEKYNLSREITSLPKLFTDIEELVSEGMALDRKYLLEGLDTIIHLGAPSSVVKLLANQNEDLDPQYLKIRDDNGVDVAFSNIYAGGSEWRTKAFLDNDFDCPLVGAFDKDGWLTSLDQLTRALFWCEGKARRAKADNNEPLLLQTLEVFKTRVLQPLDFTLVQRVKWQDSYAIPEDIFPFLYERITLLLMDCYPEELPVFLHRLSQQAENQCGLYSEGFREVMFAVLKKLVTQEFEASLSDEIFGLIELLKEHVVGGVENRHELVPELLRLIPLFVKVEAGEVAKNLYRHMLGVSMGPSWYKEDQLGLMVSVLRELPISDNVQESLPLITGYLERASWEMTFQRFVRYEKQAFLGELFRRGLFANGCRYFKRQTCGSTAELLLESQHGVTDKPSPMVGMRHPGGALDEQHAVLEMVRNIEGLDWRLCWALLEIFQFGDERYLADYAKEYARLINEHGIGAETISEMVYRSEFVVGAEIAPEERSQFLISFCKELDSSHHQAFSNILCQISHADSQPEVTEPVEDAATDDSPLQDVDCRDEDTLFLPGTFGRQSARREAESALEIAETHLKRGNHEAAKLQAVEALKSLQDGGWSIWGHLSGVSTRAEELLCEGAKNAADVVRFYAPLLEAERHESKWSIAEHLITRVAGLLSEDERNLLLKYTIEHIRLMVGDASDEIAMFSFFGDEAQCDPPMELFMLILWLLDHPHGLRRDKAAGMVAWLVESESIYFDVAVMEAFSMVTGSSADILCGVLDEASTRQPVPLWDRVFALLDLKDVLENCKHVGRLAVLHRIAERAANVGSTTGGEVVSRIVEQFRAGAIELGTSSRRFGLPHWASCISREWDKLTQIGLVSDELFKYFKGELAQLCAPLDIQGGWNLEIAVSKSFCDASNKRFNRWEAKVRFALSTALFPYATQRNFSKIEAVLRIFNPSLPEITMTPDFCSPTEAVLKAVYTGNDYAGAIGDANFFFLNYHEVMEHGDNDNFAYIEVLAVLIPTWYVSRGLPLPPIETSFSSKELPAFKFVPNPYETCCHLKPDFACFGEFTPAFPLPSFTELIKANNDDYLRVNWRNGRSNDMNHWGAAVQEGCLLAVKRTVVCLPEGKKMAWIIRINGEMVTMVDSHNNQLY